MHTTFIALLFSAQALAIGCTVATGGAASDASGLADAAQQAAGGADALGGLPTATGTTSATLVVASTAGAALTLQDGAQLLVPVGAVPPGAKGGSAVPFSIAIAVDAPAAPAGEQAASALYKLGPSGFVFALPVTLAIPVQGKGKPKPEAVRVYRVDPKTGKPERYSASYDAKTGLASVVTWQFSPWFATRLGSDPSADADGAFAITNTSTDHWVNVCATKATLKFPSQSLPFAAIAAAPAGTIGWASAVKWFLPQGTYDLCVEMQKAGTPLTLPGKPAHILLNDQVIGAPWTASDPKVTALAFATLDKAIDGPCLCKLTTTPNGSLLYVGNDKAVKNQPTAPTALTLKDCSVITNLGTYHWNNGKGQPPGTLALRSKDGGKVYGPWPAEGSPKSGPNSNVYWNAWPGVVLPAGSYELVDSDPATWAHNSDSNGAGMAWVEGVAAPCP